MNTPSARSARTPACAALLALAAAWAAWSAPPGQEKPGGPPAAPNPFSGRAGKERAERLKEGGGNAQSEAAVARGLEWLALHQANDGHWSLHELNRHGREKPLPAGKTFVCNCTPGTTRHNDVAATAFGLLPFLGAGLTHQPDDKGPKDRRKDYGKTVEAGLNWLVKKQGPDGSFDSDMYAQALATIVLCEAYGTTADPKLKEPARRAVKYVVEAQDPAGGGWRYAPRQAGDTSVTGWQFMALKSAQMAGLAVPKKTFQLAERFLDSVEGDPKGQFSYIPGSPVTHTMSAVGLLCRQYSGVSPRNPALLRGVLKLKAAAPGRTSNLYYEYYATQVMHHIGGDAWRFWNLGLYGDGEGGMRDTFIARQDRGANARTSHQKGSWLPDKEGGRMMSTSLSLLCLEVYYRHPRLYRTR